MNIRSISRLLPVTLFALFIIACKSSKKENPAPGKKTEEQGENFIPYVALLQKQVSLVDSTPLAIYKYITDSTGRLDSATIQRDEFHQLARSFMEPDIMNLQKEYASSSFGDQSTGLVNFTYTAKDSAKEVQRVNLRFKPGTPARLTSLDMIRHSGGHIQKLFWKSNRFFHIITDLGNGKYTKMEVAWNASAPEPEVERLDMPQIVK